jgi:lipopolysaccharide transport system permease protein
LGLRELWAHRELIVLLARRDVKARYKQALLGLAWTVAQPLAGMAVLYFVFRRVVGVTTVGVPYPLFALAGFAVWTYLSGTVAAVAGSLLAHGPMLTKVYLPRLAVPLSATLPGLLHLAVATALLLAALPVAGLTPPATVVVLPAGVLLALVAGFGVGLLLATVNVVYRDVGPAIGHLLQVWLLASPVAYPVSAVRGRWAALVALNPATAAVESFRAAVLGTPVSLWLVGASAATAAAVLACSLAVFARFERRLIDEL